MKAFNMQYKHHETLILAFKQNMVYKSVENVYTHPDSPVMGHEEPDYDDFLHSQSCFGDIILELAKYGWKLNTVYKEEIQHWNSDKIPPFITSFAVFYR